MGQPEGPKTYGLLSKTDAYLNKLDTDVTKRQEYLAGAGVGSSPAVACRSHAGVAAGTIRGPAQFAPNWHPVAP